MLSRPWFPFAMALAASLAIGLPGSYGVRLDQQRQAQDKHNYVVSQASQYRAALEGEVNASLYLTNGLAAYVATHSKLEPEVAIAMLRRLRSQGRHIRNIGLAPGNRLTYIYPLEGNEKAIGLYYPDLPEQWPAIERAIRERRPNLAGPVSLKQGGVGFIYRVPVFLEPSGDYWGMLSMVIEKDSLLTQAGLAPQIGELEFALRGQDGRGADGAVFFGSAAVFAAADAIKVPVSLPGGSWQLASRPIDSAASGQRAAWLHAGVWGIAVLWGVSLYFALASIARRLRAERAVRHSRDELAEAQRVAGLGSWTLDLENGRIEWSDETYRIFGLPPGSPIGFDEFAARLHPEDRERVLTAWAAAVGGADYALEHRIVVDGQVKWVQERAHVEFDAAGKALTGLGTVLDITARKQAEQERQNAEARFKLFMDNTPAIAWVKDEEGRYVYLNREHQERFGARPEDWYGRTDFELWPHEVAALFRANDLEVLSSNQPKEVEEQACEPDGKMSIWHNVKFPFSDASGRRFVAGFGVDVTQAHEASRLLKESEARLKEAQRMAQIGSWELDPQSNTLSCSEEVLHVMERADAGGSLAYDDFVAAIHPEDRDWVATAFATSLKTGRGLDITHRLEVKGLLKYVRQHGEPYGGDGAPRRMRGTIQDITLEKLAEEALRESEQRFRTVADYYYDWEYWRGPNGEFLYLSPSCERITGYSQYELITDPGLIERMVHPDDRALMDNHLRDYRDDLDHSIDFRIATKSGDIRWIAHGCRPVFSADGRFQGRRVSNRDITDRKSAEHALGGAKERLELALDAAQLSIWEYDTRTLKVSFDQAWAAMIGLVSGVDAMTAEEISRYVHADDWARIVHAVRASFKRHNAGFHVEFRFRSLVGDWKWLRCSGKVVERDARGRAVLAIGTALDITERKQTEEVIKQMAFHDQLTHLPNRRLLEDRIQQVMTRAQRERRGFSLLFIDIDKFKPINDELGHGVGDWLLQRIAERMKKCLRESDTVARVGGDEFVVLLPDAGGAEASLVGEKIRLALEQPFITPEGRNLDISSSIGIALYPEHADTMRDLLRVGDEAMYRAKKAGRNTVTVYHDIEGA